MIETKNNYRNDIQSLRAIAVLSVLVFHYNKHLLPGGFVGVDIFFVISGYLISSIILAKTENGSFTFTDFYFNRIKRIVPAYLFLLLAISIPAIVLFMPKDLLTFRAILFHSFIFNSNNYIPMLINDYFGVSAEQAPLLHTWTLSIEMQFYLIFPLLLIHVSRNWNKYIILALIGLFTAYAQFKILNGLRQDMYFSLIARIPEFLLGSLVVIWRTEEKISKQIANIACILGIVTLALSFFLINELSNFPGLYALIPASATTLILISKYGWLNRLIAVRPLVFIGKLSYSIYLWHWPVFSLIRYYTGTYSMSPEQSIIAIASIILLSLGSYKFIEVPFRKIGSWKKFLAWTTPPIICLVALGIFSKPLNKRIFNLPEQIFLRNDLGLENHNSAGPIIFRGDLRAQREFLLFGDSHALHLNPFFDIIGKSNNFKFVSMTFDRFVNVPTFDITITQSPKSDIDNWNKQQTVLKPLIKYYRIIVIGGFWISNLPERTKSLDMFFKSLSPNQDVVIISDVPSLSENPIRNQRFRKFGLSTTSQIKDTYKETDYTYLLDMIAKYRNVHFLDLRNSNFFKIKTFPYYKGMSLYYDSNHLNTFGSKMYGQIETNRVMTLLNQLFSKQLKQKKP